MVFVNGEEYIHLRAEIWFDGTSKDFLKLMVNDVEPLINGIQEDYNCYWYYFVEEYSDIFNNHIQLDLILEESENIKESMEERISKIGRPFYWADNVNIGWWGENDAEKASLLIGHLKNSEISLNTLTEFKEGEFKHSLKDFASRRQHLNANQLGLDYRDELLIALKKVLNIVFLKIFGENIYKRVFLNG